MSLAFLNKKSWHTATLKNAERVWKAEQKQKAELRKMEQLRKEKEEERQIEELRRLQAASGLNIKTHGERVDWMYEGVHAQGPTSEEYLLGKKFEGNLDGEEDDVLKLENKKAVGSIYLNKKVNEEMEEKARLREDPLVQIMYREQQARAAVLNNPVEMDKIKKKAKSMKALKKFRKKERKKEKKKRKKEKKREKRLAKANGHAKEQIQDDERDSPPPRRGSSPAGRRDNDDEDDDDKPPSLPASMANKYGLILNPNASPPPVKARTPSPSPISDDDDAPRRRNGRDRSRSGYRRRDDSRSRGRREKRRRSPTDSPPRRGRYRDRGRDRRDRDRTRDRDRGGRGRDRDRGDSEDRRPKRKLTREERLAKLREMQEDAEAHEDAKLDRVRKAKKQAMKEEAMDKDRESEAQNASFIKKMNKEVYGGSETLQERLKKHQHYRQKGGDAFSAEAFMSR
mmetsp:Transcript_33307/g.61929  ORF Transcript_33307/g.61929 Transcript_33307/m.61929 type:complete len:455 (-) Transcript_33307:457-1821(-)|eukprot:CAMPEP_0170190072 /NCGR_PEP_ID=MMETSP0040_2-20121228/48507_1 /TAXON_ID=641309 /ORGANISM="Lotharella oceanica, Strain CCMP622" /LENGTH=454 /DNA_ID=CAMNT_0010437843 /DNA_START=30 /DNA_END=1394 /DNA_ORIENTATION=-